MRGTYVRRLYGKLDVVTDLDAFFQLRDEEADLTDDVSAFDEAGLARDGRDDAAVANRSSRVLEAHATGRQVARPWTRQRKIHKCQQLFYLVSLEATFLNNEAMKQPLLYFPRHSY